MIRCSAIILAAGKGKRFGSSVSKPLVKINLKPSIIYSLEAIKADPCVKEIIIAVNRQNRKKVIQELRRRRLINTVKVVLGGKRRQDSVRNGLRNSSAMNSLVLIHDAARPFIDRKTVSSVIREAKRTGAAIVGVPVKATIKKVSSCKFQVAGKRQKKENRFIVKETLDRDNLWEIQTPQVFNKELILRGFSRFGNVTVTDDAMLVEKIGVPVSVVAGSYKNIKITTREDLILAEAIAKNAV